MVNPKTLDRQPIDQQCAHCNGVDILYLAFASINRKLFLDFFSAFCPWPLVYFRNNSNGVTETGEWWRKKITQIDHHSGPFGLFRNLDENLTYEPTESLIK